jgi:DNA-binding HxlR family transcriptional regulator
MSWDETSESVCDIARGLSVFGDRWTLLIMRELSMGVRRFEDIQAQTGMSSNLLAIRLKRLEEDEVIERRQYSAHANRFEYHATKKGRELDGVLLAIRAWALRWGGLPTGSEPAVALVYKKTGESIDALWQPPSGKKPFSFADTESSVSKKFAKEREARVTAFRESRGKGEKKSPRPMEPAAKSAAKHAAVTAGAGVSKAVAKKAAPQSGLSLTRTPAKKKVTAVKRTSKAA